MTAKVIPTPKQVIENQLLVALDDKSKVSLIFNKNDLGLVIEALGFSLNYLPKSGTRAKLTQTMLTDLEQLRTSAFPSGG